MTISRVYPAGWSLGEKFTSAQANGLDVNTTYAADKRAGQTDTIQAVWSMANGGRVVDTYSAGPNADTTFLVSNANTIIDVNSITADRVYTLSNTNAQAGDRISVLNRSAHYVQVNNAASTRLVTLGSQIGNGSLGESYWAEFLYTGAQWVLWKSSKGAVITPWLFTSSDSFNAPCGAFLLVGCGGGGSGASGDPARGANKLVCGGSGGGGAIEYVRLITGVTVGAKINVNIGAGGTGPASSTTAASGQDGGDTTVVRDSDSAVLATWLGAQGGIIGPGNTAYHDLNSTTIIDGNTSQNGTTMARYAVAAGGSPTRSQGGAGLYAGHSTDPFFLSSPVPQQGGRGRSGGNGEAGAASSDILVLITGERGGSSPQGYFGGVCGATGAYSSAYMGGGPGGGGGAGPYGDGANGGAGRNGDTGTVGGAGADAADNTGAGGGGGGASGGYGSAVAGGKAGSGGSGRLLVIPLR